MNSTATPLPAQDSGPPDIGISTCWRSGRTRDSGTLLDEVTAFAGITGVELEYRILPDLLEPLLQGIRARGIRVFSVHNFCPHPAARASEKPGGDVFLLSSPEPEERAQAVAHTRRTLELAAEVGARAVVLHLGRVEMEEPMDQLKALYDQGDRDSTAYRSLLGRVLRDREALRSPYLAAVERSLGELVSSAQQLGVTLGIETRYYLREIPSYEETARLLETFRGAPVGYWHDMGHAAVQETLGLHDGPGWLNTYADRLAGVHIHDTRGHEDHLAPGDGTTDFSQLREHLAPSTPGILELRPDVTPEALRQGLATLRNALQASGRSGEAPIR